MTDDTDGDARFAATLEKLIDHLLVGVDDLATVILKGHLLVEEALTELLTNRVFRDPKHFRSANLRFAQKLSLCRSWAPQREFAPMWTLAEAINELRNDLAHDIATKRRAQKIAQVRGAYKTVASGRENIPSPVSASDEEVLIASCALIAGAVLAVALPNRSFPSEKRLAEIAIGRVLRRRT